MKIQELFFAEMTLRAGNVEQLASTFLKANEDRFLKGEHVGDIDQEFNVLKTDDAYILTKENEVVSFIQLTRKFDLPVAENVWTRNEFRKRNLFSKLLWFMKSREGMNKILLGDVHSQDMQEVTKHLSRFIKSWYNGTDTEKYSLETQNNFTSFSRKTGWFLMLENDGDFSDWPRFKGTDWIREAYDWQIE